MKPRPSICGAPLLWTVAVLWSAPLLIMCTTSLRPTTEIIATGIIGLPAHPSITAWLTAVGAICNGTNCVDGLAGIRNSVLITLPAALISTVFGAISGFALATLPKRLSNRLTLTLLAGMIIPPQIVIYPMIGSVSAVGLFRTLPGLTLVHLMLGMPMAALLSRSFYLTVPKAIFDSARVDGASNSRIYISIALPISLPLFVILFVLQFGFVWNDVLMASIFGPEEFRPMTIILSSVGGSEYAASLLNVYMATALIASLPTIFLYALAMHLAIPLIRRKSHT